MEGLCYVIVSKSKSCERLKERKRSKKFFIDEYLHALKKFAPVC